MVQVLNVLQVKAGCALVQERVLLAMGFWWLGQWHYDSILWELVEG